MTLRPAALKPRQPAVGSLPIVAIVVPAISRKGAKNQLRREQAYRPCPSICTLGGEGKNRRWPNSGGGFVTETVAGQRSAGKMGDDALVWAPPGFPPDPLGRPLA